MNETANTKRIEIGNVVTGTHHGIDIIGRVTGWIPAKNGGLWIVSLDGEIVLYGIPRTEVSVPGYETKNFTVIDHMTATAEQSSEPFCNGFYMAAAS